MNAHLDLKLLDSVLRWMLKIQDEEGCDISSLFTAFSAVVKIAHRVMHGSGETSDLPSSTTCSIEFQVREWVYSCTSAMLRLISRQELASLISECTHPIYLTQSLMGNLPNRDTKRGHRLSGILGMPWEEGTAYSPLVPKTLQPDTYGFNLYNGILIHPATR